jgi:DMSO reductase anchor subunit
VAVSESEVTREGQRGVRPGREAVEGVTAEGGPARRRRRRGDKAAMVPDADFGSYYGQPILNAPVWESDIPTYFFLGGLAGGSSLLAAGADLTGREGLRRTSRLAALGAVGGSLAALIHDLGVPKRFLNMLRVAKPTSPMSVGTWLLMGYGPLAGAAAVSDYVRPLRPLGRLTGLGAAVLGPAVAAYTGVLIADTAVPAWHDGYREMPFVFVGSGGTAAGGLGLLAAPREAEPARRLGALGAVLELGATHLMQHRLGMVAEPYQTGKGGRLMHFGEACTIVGAVGAQAGRRSRLVSALSGAALLAGSAAARFGVFHAGMDSANDPKYTVGPQRERLDGKRGQDGRAAEHE